MNLHSAYHQHQQLLPHHQLNNTHSHVVAQPQQQQQQSYITSTSVPLDYTSTSDVLSKFKLRFIPSDDFTKHLLSVLGKKLFLDLTLKVSKIPDHPSIYTTYILMKMFVK